jgi:hypothetical protein
MNNLQNLQQQTFYISSFVKILFSRQQTFYISSFVKILFLLTVNVNDRKTTLQILLQTTSYSSTTIITTKNKTLNTITSAATIQNTHIHKILYIIKFIFLLNFNTIQIYPIKITTTDIQLLTYFKT